MVLVLIQFGIAFMAADWFKAGLGDGSALVCGGIWTLVATLVLGLNLADRAVTQGYRSSWGLLAVLSFAGVAVIYLLPDRTREPAGFPVEPLNGTRT
jgi:hypothetical protein